MDGGDTVLAGQRLRSLRSGNGRFTFVYQGDGNLVLSADGSVVLWASGTSGAGEAVLQGDGNFVIYDASGQAVWSTSTVGAGARLTLQNDGNVVLSATDGSPVWNTATAGYGGGGGGHDPGAGAGGGGDACASPDTHEHAGSCGGADSCGHVFGGAADCGCDGAPIVYDTCSQVVCETHDVWVDEFCQATSPVCDWARDCWTDDDGLEQCTDSPRNCRDESSTYACGGHWDQQQANCRDESYACRPHQCEAQP